ncbi:MAG: helix-turn-helix domain-containing protein [Caldicoprobacterales bacterium]
MTQKEITRLRVINQTIDKVITIREAAELLNLSERQVIRFKRRSYSRRSCVHHP